MPYIYVEASEVLGEIDTNDLSEELRKRGGEPSKDEFFVKAYELLHAGRNTQALELLREAAEEHTGRII